jgi:MHS family proline/betaine transporter-like MFS transporter
MLGGVIGNTLEWYDFAVFGYFAPIIGSQFFPSDDPVAGTIKAFGVFAAGYLMRPLGGVFFGHMGDKLGRKRALQISVLMMGIPTTLVGFLPTYGQVGVLGAVLLVLLRLVQGLSVGGELMGSVSFMTEIAPKNRRGLFGSFSMLSVIAGVMIGSALAALEHGLLSTAALHSWGWRIPFLLGFALCLVGIWLRRGIAESPDFDRIKTSGDIGKSPVMEALRTSFGNVVHIAALVVGFTVGFYMLFVWWPTYLTKIVSPAVPHALFVNTICMGVFMVLNPVAGWLSDLYGRRAVLAPSYLILALVAYPLFVWTDYGTFSAALTSQIIFAVLMAGVFGVVPSAMAEMFPTRTRYSGIGLGYNFSISVFGGTTPLLCTWLTARTHDVASPAYYLVAVAAVSLVASLALRRGPQEAR